MILTKPAILKEIKKGAIKITPLNKSNIGPASIDLTLAKGFRIFKKLKILDITETGHYENYTQLINSDNYVMQPGETILGITKEKINLPDNMCGWLQGRSRFARMGLAIHITASFVQPGVNNKQVLELSNLSGTKLKIKQGIRICQLIIQRCEGKALYKGRFAKQTKI